MLRKFFLSVVSCALLLSCEPAATFHRPQPDRAPGLSNFPKRIQGKYLGKDAPFELQIADQYILSHYSYDQKIPKDSLGHEYQMEADMLVNQFDGRRYPYTMQSDTLLLHLEETDTIFSISENQILKKFKGNYFLNTKLNDTSWEVKKLFLQKGVLSLATIETGTDIEKLKAITETEADTVSRPFSLSHRQFKNFVKQNGFSGIYEFVRVR